MGFGTKLSKLIDVRVQNHLVVFKSAAKKAANSDSNNIVPNVNASRVSLLTISISTTTLINKQKKLAK